MWRQWRPLLCLAAAVASGAGPVDFGKQEFERALAERKISPQRYRIQTEVSTDTPESFRILPGRVSGGDVRGLMYGLLEAADQIRSRGWLVAVKGSPAMAVRGVRLALRAGDLGKAWFSSREHWEQFFAMLARSRFNRVNLAFDESAVVNERVLDALHVVSEVASECGVDLAVSILPDAIPMAAGGLKALLAGCPAVRTVQVPPGAGGAAGPRDQGLVAVVSEAGRRMTLELEPQDLTQALESEAAAAGVPLRIPVKYGSTILQRRPGEVEMIWRLEAGAVEPGQWNDSAFVRKTVQDMIRPGFSGFEIDAPAPSSGAAERTFYTLWGRLSYDPRTPAPGPARPVRKP